jgi:hypothetical protein
VNGSCSGYKKVLSGVPQGSILGPLLFLYYINDLDNDVENECVLSLYADDSKIARKIGNVNDCIKLQQGLDQLWNWGLMWGMYFNPKKCYVMNITRNRNKFKYNYVINKEMINNVKEVRDLGITVTNSLNWDSQIKKMVNKASSKLGMIKRCLGYRVKQNIKIKAYTSIVRPHLEYCSMLWSYSSKKCLNTIERVQRRATCYITNDYSTGYKDRLIQCNLLPLSLRRDFLDLSFMYNCINDVVNVNLIELFHCTSHELNVEFPVAFRCKTEQGLKFFNARIHPMWYMTPENIRALELSDNGKNMAFKKQLKIWLWEHFLNKFITENQCTWILRCRCANCRMI